MERITDANWKHEMRRVVKRNEESLAKTMERGLLKNEKYIDELARELTADCEELEEGVDVLYSCIDKHDEKLPKAVRKALAVFKQLCKKHF